MTITATIDAAERAVAVRAAEPAITDAAVSANVVAGIRFLAAQLADARLGTDGSEAASAEAARAELCRWAEQGVRTVEGRLVDRDEIRRVATRELDLLTCGTSGAFRSRRLRAGELFIDFALDAPYASTLAAQANEQPA